MEQQNQIKCQIHPSEAVIAAYVSSHSRNSFACIQCIIFDQQRHQFISISDVLSDNTIVQNWPNGIRQGLLDYICGPDCKDLIKTKIRTFYKQVQSTIIEALHDQEERTLKQIDYLQFGKPDLVNFYNEHFLRDELSDLIRNNLNNVQDQFQELLKKIELKKVKDLGILEGRMKEFEKMKEFFSQDFSVTIQPALKKFLNCFFYGFSNCLAPQQDFINSYTRQDQQLKVGLNEKGKYYITNNSQPIRGQVYSNFILEKNKSYTVRLEFNKPIMQLEGFNLGLIEGSEMLEDLCAGQLNINQELLTQKTQLIKGSFNNAKQYFNDINQLEVRICQNRGILQYSDYPNYSYVFENKESMSKTKDYRICVSLCRPQEKIIIINELQETTELAPFVFSLK